MWYSRGEQKLTLWRCINNGSYFLAFTVVGIWCHEVENHPPSTISHFCSCFGGYAEIPHGGIIYSNPSTLRQKSIAWIPIIPSLVHYNRSNSALFLKRLPSPHPSNFASSSCRRTSHRPACGRQRRVIDFCLHGHRGSLAWRRLSLYAVGNGWARFWTHLYWCVSMCEASRSCREKYPIRQC